MNLLQALALCGLVALVYWPVQYAGFIWDDDAHLTSNPTIAGPLGLKDIWTPRAADIAPLTRSTFWVEHAIWGFAPQPYHLFTLALHAACTVLLWQLLRRFRVPGAWVAALLWAIHPVQVESVAWVAEMKNTESAFFLLLSILCYISWLRWQSGDTTSARRSRLVRYSGTLFFAVLAMTAKSSTVILPPILLLCAWWHDEQWDRKIAIRRMTSVIPVFLMSLIVSAQSIWSTHALMQTDPDPQPVRSLAERLIGAGDAFWFYLGKLVWPYPQEIIYPYARIDAGVWPEYLPALAAIALMLIVLLKRRQLRPLYLAAAWFTFCLLPVLGLLDHYELRYALVFDHFQYLAAMGPLALAGIALAWLPDLLTRFTVSGRKWLRVVFCTLVLSISGLRSWQRAWVFQNEETLWTDTLARNPDSWAAHNNLGNALFEQGRLGEAIEQYQAALDLHSGNVKALANLGLALSAEGRQNESLAYLRRAVELGPSSAVARNSLGLTLSRLGRYQDAIAEFETALRLDPGYANARANMAKTEAILSSR